MSGNSRTVLPARGRARAPESHTDGHLLTVLTIELVAIVLFQKLAIPLGGRETQVSSAFLIHFGVLAYLMRQGMVRISGQRLVLLCVFASTVGTLQIASLAQGFSLPSMVLMLATTSMLVFVMPMTVDTFRRFLARFVWLGLAASGLVVADWAAQAAGWSMPDLETLIPRMFVYYEYNYIQPVQWGSRWMKPNGLFFLETSHVSQFIGMALVVELALFRRFVVVSLLGGALLATFGVTGMLLVGSSIPVLLTRVRSGIIASVLVTLPIIGAAAYQTGLADELLRRTDEFSQRSSSGYNRFILPLEWASASVTGPLDKAVSGSGAGTMPKAINDDEQGIAGFAWPPYTKIIVEYGTLAFAVWACLLLTSIFGHGIPPAISWAAFAQYNFLNGSLNVPIHTVYCVILCSGPLLYKYSKSEQYSIKKFLEKFGSRTPLPT